MRGVSHNTSQEKHKEEMISRIASDGADRTKLREALETCIDPLLPTDATSDDIVNIYSGQVSKSSVNVDRSVEIGNELMQKFVSSWPEGFRETISKKVTTMAVSKKGAPVNGVIVYNTEIIFSRVMCLISAGNIKIEDVFSYELSPIPTSLFDEYGGGRYPKAKSELKNAMKIDITKRTAKTDNVIVLDGCAIMWVVHWPDKGKVLDYVTSFFTKVSSYLKDSDVFLIFDRYYDYSPKSCTRQERLGSINTRHTLSLSAPLPPQSTVLKSVHNKIQLIEIIVKYLLEHTKSEQKLIITSSNEVPEEIHNGVHQKRNDLSTSHEEADLIIPQQVLFAIEEGAECVKVVSDDTDVFVLLVHFFHLKQPIATILMEATKEEWNIIDIGQTAIKHKDIAPNVLAGHALTGCDSVPQMFGIGKKTVFKQLSKFPLTKLGEQDVEMEDIMLECKRFIAACYGYPDQNDMSILRYRIWRRKTETGKLTQSFKLCSLPPSNAALHQNILRAHLQCAHWRSSLQRDHPHLDPSKHGWIKDEKTKTLVPVMIPDSVKVAPDEILKRICCKCPVKHCSTNPITMNTQCSCAKAQMACTTFCSCNEDLCQNKKIVQGDDVNDENDTTENTDIDILDMV